MDTFEKWAIGGASIIVVAALILLGVRDCNKQNECETNGGRVERYNYRTIFVTHSCGSNCFFTTPVEVSDWRCVNGK